MPDNSRAGARLGGPCKQLGARLAVPLTNEIILGNRDRLSRRPLSALFP